MPDLNNENNFIKVESQTDLSEVAKEAYHDGGKEFVKELGRVGATVVGLFNNTIGAPFEIYNAWAKLKINEVKQEIENKMLKIPKDKLIFPPINIIGPAMEGLKYNLNEDELKEMFANLITNSCNSDFSKKVHPRFVEILKQLSSNDALLLKEFHMQQLSISYPITKIRLKEKNSYGGKDLFTNYFICEELNIDFENMSSIISNLQSLGIIEVNYLSYLTDEHEYDKFYNTEFYKNYKQQKEVNINCKLELQKGLVRITPLGKSFIETCVEYNLEENLKRDYGESLVRIN